MNYQPLETRLQAWIAVVKSTVINVLFEIQKVTFFQSFRVDICIGHLLYHKLLILLSAKCSSLKSTEKKDV